MIIHPIPPVYDKNSRILILGSFPSVKSREVGFFYGHPQNRFWRLMAALFNDDPGESPSEKRDFLIRHQIAVWDVIASCKIEGSSDSSVRDVTPNDLTDLLQYGSIQTIYCNGNLSYSLYQKYMERSTGIAAVKLPSTSPANAAWSFERLIKAWLVITK